MGNLLLIVAGIAIVLAVAYAAFNYFCVNKIGRASCRDRV